MRQRHVLKDDIGFLLSRASGLVISAVHTALAPYNLKVRQYTVLAFACDEPNGATQRRIAEQMGLDPSQIVSIVDDLENRGLVLRTPDPKDRRNKILVATETGKSLCEQARHACDQASGECFSDFDQKNIDTLRSVLVEFVFPEPIVQSHLT